MNLDSKQMHIASQLFMAGSKAGKPFDLARLTKDAVYASETLAALSMHAEEHNNDHLQSLAALAMDMLSKVTMPAPLSANATPNASSTAIAPTTTTMVTTLNTAEDANLALTQRNAPQKYVGRLR